MGLLDFFKKKKEPKFKIGETVICIDDRNHVIIYKQEYEILDINECGCKNDRYAYDIGLTTAEGNGTECTVCKVKLPGRDIYWIGEGRFKKKVMGKFLHGKFIYGKPKRKKQHGSV